MAPAPVDHEERRRALTRVLLDLVAERGIEGASIRALATAAGVSIGTVQHYFASKDDLLRHAYRQMAAEAGEHAERRAGAAATPADALREVLLELLPLDRRRERALRIGLAFGVRALQSSDLAAELQRDTRELLDGLRELLAAAGAADPRREAIAVMALNDGLSSQLLFDEELTGAEAVAVLDAHLARVLSR